MTSLSFPTRSVSLRIQSKVPSCYSVTSRLSRECLENETVLSDSQISAQCQQEAADYNRRGDRCQANPSFHETCP